MSRSADCSKVIRSLPPRTLSCPPSNFHTEDQPLYIESGRSIPHGISLSAFLYPCSFSITERFLTLCFRGGEKTGGVGRTTLSCRLSGYFATKEDARAFGNVHCIPAMCFRAIGKGHCIPAMCFRVIGNVHCILTMRFRVFGNERCTFAMRFRAFGHVHCSHCKALPRSSRTSRISFHLQ